jgi:hypothetical protein
MARKKRSLDKAEPIPPAPPSAPAPAPSPALRAPVLPWRPPVIQPPMLKPGELIRMIPGGPPYRVESVTESRAYCLPIRAVKAAEGETDVSPVGGVNISPRAYVERITEQDLLKPKPEKEKEETVHMASTAAIPMSGKSSRSRDKERKASLSSRRAAAIPSSSKRKLAGAAARSAARPKMQKTVRDCACGCGEETMSYFAPGHDGRWHGWMKKIAAGADPADIIPNKKVRDSYTFKKKGAGMVPTLDYRGEPYVAKH